jgi:hypothetical protein
MPAPDARKVQPARRDRLKEALRAEWQKPSLAKLRGRAERAYQAFLAGRA